MWGKGSHTGGGLFERLRRNRGKEDRQCRKRMGEVNGQKDTRDRLQGYLGNKYKGAMMDGTDILNQ